MPVHGIDDGNNKHAVYTAEEVLAILQQAIDSGSLQGIDPEKNPIVAAVRESHNNSNLTFWSGTEAEFNEMTGVTSELIGARIGSDGRLYLLTGDTTLSDTVEAARQAALEATEGMKREVISVTLLANAWSNTAPYTQTVAVAGMTADKDFLAPYVVPTGNESDDLAAQVALSCISGGSTDTDSVTFYCYDEKPTTTITVFMVDKGTKIESGDYPVASTTNLGMIKVGNGLNITPAGELSAESFEAGGYFFDTVADMKAADLLSGSIATTLGFGAVNDGGGATYKILSSGVTTDGFFSFELTNGNVADMIVDGAVDIRKIGATTEADAHDYILAVINKNYECLIPSGRWKTSPLQIAKYDSARIKGQSIYGNNNSNGTILTPVADQDYILKVGFDNTTSIANDILIENIQFNSNGYQLVNAVLFSRVQFSKFDELGFRNCKCSDCAFRIRETWETRFGRIMFRATDAPYCLVFGDKVGSGNISTDYFEYMSFEGSRGNCIKFEDDCAYSMNTIDTIDFESGTAAFSDETRVGINTVADYTALAIIELNNGKHNISINNLNLNNIAMHAYTNTTTGTSRAFDRVIEGKATDSGYISVAINTIAGTGNTNPPILVNATKLDKFYCLSNIFEGGQAFTCNIEGCRVFRYLPSDFCDNYFLANIDRAYRDLKISGNKPSCLGTSRAVRVASLKKTGDTLYFHAKGTGQVWFGSEHISATDASAFNWYSLDITNITLGETSNLLISSNANVEIDDYFIA